MHAATKAKIKPGDLAVVLGAGPIGMVTALAALAGGCSQVVITDVVPEKLALARALGPITAVNVAQESLVEVVNKLTANWGADVVFEASGNARSIASVFEPLCPGGRVVFVGMPSSAVQVDIVAAQAKEASIETIFRYAHMYPRALALLGSGKIDVKPLLTDTFAFQDSIKAFDYATHVKPTSVKIQIVLP
jgi:D-xylulose reductase